MSPEMKTKVADALYSAFAARHMLKEDQVEIHLRVLVTLFGLAKILKTED